MITKTQLFGFAAAAASVLTVISVSGSPPALRRAAAPPNYAATVLPLPAGQIGAFPNSMNHAGVVAGQFGSDSFDPLAAPAVMTKDRIMMLAKPYDSLNFALGLGSANLIVGSSANFPVAWVKGVATLLSPAGGLVQGSANDANLKGAICGTLFNDITGDQIPVLWPGAFAPGVALPLGTASGGGAFAINDRGHIAGFVSGGSFVNFEAVRWDSPSQPPVPLGKLPGAMNSEAIGVNRFGDAAGRSSFPDNSVQAILHIRRTNSMIGLGALGGNYSFARAVNAARRVVGTSSTGGGEVHAFLWQDGAMYDLNILTTSASEPILYVADAVAIDDKHRIAAQVFVASPSGPVSRIALLTPAGP